MTQPIRRALLFMPGDDRKKIEKGAALAVDGIIMDIEDGVALTNKATARLTINHALKEVDFGKSERLVRINALNDDNRIYIDDIDHTIEGHPDGYVIPKVESAEQVKQVAEHLTLKEREYGYLDGSIRLFAIIESAYGVINLETIASADPRLKGLMFGAEDLAGDIGAVRTPDMWEVFYARSKLVLYAKAHGLDAIDTPFVDLTADDSQLIAQTEQAHYMGYTGKLAIHPKHVPVIQQIFTPSIERIRKAKALIDAHDAHQKAGAGVFAFEGRMVDMPMVRAAQTVIAQAKSAGIDVDNLPDGGE
ncbi:MAG: CoA ester lyase [Aggregatilineales bacterium]